MIPPWDQLVHMAQTEVQRTLAELPPELHRRARALPVSFERHPNRQLEADGIAPDTLGLFVGEAFPEGDGATQGGVPPQIILFLENLWYDAGEDEAICRDEIRVTYLHELGHYLGLDEEDLDDRGLL